MIIGLIPARSASKGVPNKNIRLLGGYPLMAWAIVASQLSEMIDRTVVTTDSVHYRWLAEKYGAEVIMRPPEICHDLAGDITYVEHALEVIPADYVVILRPTTPLRGPIDIKWAVNTFFRGDYSGLRSIHQTGDSAFKAYTIDEGKLVGCYADSVDEANEPRQHFPPTYEANGLVDIVRAEEVCWGFMFGDKVFPLLTHDPGEIDKEEDFDYIEFRLEKYGSLIYEYLRKTYKV